MPSEKSISWMADRPPLLSSSFSDTCKWVLATSKSPARDLVMAQTTRLNIVDVRSQLQGVRHQSSHPPIIRCSSPNDQHFPAPLVDVPRGNSNQLG